MVQKKTNCAAVNSGNSMKKRYYRQLHQRNMACTTHVIKSLCNMPLMKPDDRRKWEVDAAEAYVDDGGLEGCEKLWRQFSFHSLKHIYSLNKKKRWLLEDIVEDAVHDDELTNESFKITLVHRAVHCHGYVNTKNRFCNVDRYYDSHCSKPVVAANTKSHSTRLSLIQKATEKGKENIHRKSSVLWRKRNHNQHFRGTQRKRYHYRVTPDEPQAAPVPEIRYEIANTQMLTSSDLTCHERGYRFYHRYNQQPKRMGFRGFHKEKVEWYYTDAVLPFVKNRQLHGYATDSVFVEEDEETESLWGVPPEQQEYSLLDLAMATKNKAHRKLNKKSHKVTTANAQTAVNSASGQQVRRYGKGEVIYIDQEDEEERMQTMDEDMDDTSNTAFETDSDADSGLQSNEDSDARSLEGALSSPVDYEGEFLQFDQSFCSCGVPDSELRICYLQDMFGAAVEFGKCVPFTVKFDVHAVWMEGQKELQDEGCGEEEEDKGVGPEDWWLLCQTREGNLGCDFIVDSGPHGDTVMMKLNLIHGSHEESVVAGANQQLKQLVTDEEGQPVVMSMYVLLDRVCDIVGQLPIHRWGNSYNGCKTEGERQCKPLDTHLPHERYTGQVKVCSVKEAYHHLQSTKQVKFQCASPEELGIFCSLTWCNAECSVCFTSFEDGQISEDGFSSCVTMTTCGHSFCRRCWQHYLLSSVVEGQTTLHCMEYKCEATVDCTTLMSLVPQWVYGRWQQRLCSKAVESSGEWKWCPNARCGLLAKTHADREMEKQEEKKGVPVVCQCQKRWCLDCGRDAHWPLTCIQFITYSKMLKQHGDEDGLKTNAVEISSVNVKRCPFCRYPIEKNGGCMHMSCSRCGGNFCWNCLVDWSQHCTGAWQGCHERGAETIDLENVKLYPLPIECYKKAASYRFTWKKLDRQHHRTFAACRNHFAAIRRKKGKDDSSLPDNAVNYVADALIFLKKGNMLLEMAFILLSNSPRRHRLAKQLREYLQFLHFTCDRVTQFMKQPVKRVLKTSENLHHITRCGHHQVHRVCHLAHCLVSKVKGTAAQEWLLQGDHERFVKYK